MGKNLVIDARMLQSSGIGIYLKELLSHFKTYAQIHCLIKDEDRFFFDEKSIPYTIFNERIYSIKEQLKYYSVIPEADIFWSPHYNTPLLPIKCKRRVVTIHDAYHLSDISEVNMKQKLYANILMYNSTRRSDRVITVSEFSKQEIIHYTNCKADKVTVIHNGVVKNETISNLPNGKYSLPEKYLLFVGNVKPHKNLIIICQAFLKLPINLRNELKIVIVGKKDGFINGDSALIHLINNDLTLRQNVIFTGYVAAEDMNAIYRNASVFIFPSLYEGFGLPPLEAMSNSTPVICSDILPLQEVCGEAAMYFDPKDPNDLVQCIIRMIDTETVKKYISSGLEQVKKFTWKASFNKHLEVFNL